MDRAWSFVAGFARIQPAGVARICQRRASHFNRLNSCESSYALRRVWGRDKILLLKKGSTNGQRTVELELALGHTALG